MSMSRLRVAVSKAGDDAKRRVASLYSDPPISVITLIIVAAYASPAWPTIIPQGSDPYLFTLAYAVSGPYQDEDGGPVESPTTTFVEYDNISSSGALVSARDVDPWGNVYYADASANGYASISIDPAFGPHYAMLDVAESVLTNAYAGCCLNYYNGAASGTAVADYSALFILDSPYHYAVTTDLGHLVGILGNANMRLQETGFGGNVVFDRTITGLELSDPSGVIDPGTYQLYVSADCDSEAQSFPYEGYQSAGICSADFAFSLQLTAVPIPATVYLFASGLLGLVGIARRRAA